MSQKLIVASVLGFSSVAALGGESRPESFTLCKNAKAVRTIHVMEASDKSCTTIYSKNGRDEVVGRSRSLEGCKSILKSIQDTLSSANWACRSVKHAQLTTSDESVQ